jgi:hypothetical protein
VALVRFQAFLSSFIKDFEPEQINKEKDLWLNLKKIGEFVVTKGKAGEEITDFSEDDFLKYNLICFLNLVKFWDEFNDLRSINAIKTPVVIKLPDNFIFDLNCLIEKVIQIKSQYVILE